MRCFRVRPTSSDRNQFYALAEIIKCNTNLIILSPNLFLKLFFSRKMIDICKMWICLGLQFHLIIGSVSSLSPKMITVINDTNEWNSFNSTNQSSLCVCHVQSLPHCECFEDVLSQMHSNTIVNITIPSISLSSNIELRDIHDITIIGHNNPEITCNSTRTLLLNNCSNVVIRNIIWKSCGHYYMQGVPGRDYLSPQSRLQFHFGTNVTIQRCAFIETYVKIYEVSGNVDIVKVHFSDGVNPGDLSIGGLFIKYSKQVKSIVSVNDSIFGNTAPNRFGGQLFEVKAIHSANFSLRTANSVFANGTNYFRSLRPGSYYKRDLVSISMHTSWHFSFANVIFTNVTFDSNTFIDGSIVSISNNYNIHLSSCLFRNNTASNIMFFNVESLQLQRSRFQNNNGKSALVSVMYFELIERIRTDDKLPFVSFNKLIFTSNVGGPLLSVNRYNVGDPLASVNRYIKIKFQQLQISHNVLQSGHGLVVVSDYYHLNVTVSNMIFKFNQILTNGSAFYCSSSAVDIPKSPYPGVKYDIGDPANHVPRRYNRAAILIPPPKHRLHLNNTIFEHNRGGGHGAGVYISHICDYCPVFGSYTIKNSKFNNISDINSVVYHGGSNYSRYTTNVIIKDCVFSNNVGTALYLVNSNLIFDEGVTLFEKNTAEQGGALYLDLNSKLTFATQSNVIFNNNQAIRYGGVMYCNVLPSNNCYRNINNILEVMNSTNLQFNDNVAVIGGSSVFFSISSPCDGVFQSELNITEHVLGEQIVTSPVELRLDPPAYLLTDYSEMEENGVNSVNDSEVRGSGVDLVNILGYPTYTINNIMLGQDIAIPVCLVDENGKPAGAVSFSVVTISGNDNYSIEGDIIYSLSCMSSQEISNLQVTGKEPIVDTNPPTIVIQFHSLYDTAYTWTPIIVNLRIELSPCHSGFQYDNQLEKCICYDRGDTIQCSGSSAKIRRGHWFGVVGKQTTVGICPVNYCNLRNCEGTTTFCPLLSLPDDQCGEHRLGIACGECEDGYTLSYDSIVCVNTNKCTMEQTVFVVTMTFLYWIVSIILVFTIMFFKVGIWNFYGLTFYYSVADLLLGQVLSSSGILYRIVTILSSLARLTPQFLGELCFVKGLSGIDQQFIHYIHPLAVLVILLLISISARFSRRLSLFVSRGIIHVICFLLLLSYTSIASTSLLLMRPLRFTGVSKVFTHLSPDLEYFNGRHLVYGLVAIVCGLVIAIGLPLLLLLEPFLNHKINFTRFKPLLDQFQGCYKDKYRCFASYYMMCRPVLLIIVNINVTNIFTKAYIQLVALVIMVLIHLIVRPYASEVLNIVDGLVLVTMILITTLQPLEAGNGSTINTANGLAFTLLLLPLFIVLILIATFIKQPITSCLCTVKNKNDDSIKENTTIPNMEYQVTIDQALRERTRSTIM